MPAEARTLTRRLIPFGGEVCLREGVFLYLGGVGPTRSRLAAEALLGRGADALLSWGSAGGLVSNLPPGSLVLPKTVIAADQTAYPVDMKWHADPMAESPAVLARPAEKKALFRRSGAIAVDMESAAVAAVAQKAKIPFMIIRAIADTVDRTVPQSILAAVDGFGRLRFFELLKGIVKRPTELLALVQLARDFRAACASLAAVARLTGGNFLAP